MKFISNKLGRQLLVILVLVFDIVLINILIFIPRAMTPIYESMIYNTLKNPLDIINTNLEGKNFNNGIVYVYYIDDVMYISNNYDKYIKVPKTELNKYLKDEFGNFESSGKKYYYYVSLDGNSKKVALASDTYFSSIRDRIILTVIGIFSASFLVTGLIVFLWSSLIVRKIIKLKNKVANIDNDNYNHNVDFLLDDEIRSLALSIEDARISLKEEEEYKNGMYQNISHDFKTPITVIKSYIEAVDDGVEDKDEALKVIKEQTDKLEKKVYSLLYLNKLEYLKENLNENMSYILIKPVVTQSIDKFKYQRKDVKITTKIDNSKFFGTEELWETIIDNILNNFIRYAEKEISVTVKNNKIILYNDGPKIDEKLINDMFNPFKKGIKGQFGLGLSIVKKTLLLLNYDIDIENNKKGVSFVIGKKK